MNASILGRMLWKEYRTQRGLWFALVGFYVVAVACIVLFLPAKVHPSFQDLMTGAIIGTLFYVFSSAAVTYASEREQGTDVFLRTIPLGPTRLLIAKVGWVVLSSLAALVVLIVIAKFAARFSTSQSQLIDNNIIALTLLIMAASLAASLLCDHVLKAVSVAFAMLVAVIIGAISLRDADNIVAYGILPTAFFAVVVELNRRWLRESSSTWKFTLPQVRPLTLNQALALPLETSPTARLWRRELKLEAWNARWWLLLLGVGSAAILLLTDLRMASEIRALQFGVIACFVPLMCGAGTCAGEQLRNRYLFQGNRGVSSTTLILAKHVVWFSGGLAVVLVLAWLSWSDILITPSAADSRLHDSYNIVPLPRQMLPTSVAREFGQSSLPGLQLAIGVGLLMYAVGHFCSLVITIPIIAIFAAIVGAVLAWAGILYSYALGVPLYVSAVAPVVAILSLPLIRGGDWIIGNKTKSSWLRFTGWTALAAWTLITLHAGWRILEISTVETTAAGTASTLGVSYLTWLAVAFFAVLVGVWMIDLFRRRIDGRRWLDLSTVAVLFLVAHNSMIAFRSVGYSMFMAEQAQPMRDAYERLRLLVTEEPEFANQANAAVSAPLPIAEDLWPDRHPNDHATPPAMRKYLRHRIPWQSWNDVLPEQRQWLSDNARALEIFRQARDSGFPNAGIAFVVRRSEPVAVPLSLWDYYGNLIDLVRLKALEREHAGDLAEAWKYHLSLIQLIRSSQKAVAPAAHIASMNWIKTILFEHDLWRWQARKEQTPELLSTATAQLASELQHWPSLSEAYLRTGGELLAEFDHSRRSAVPEDILVPWERMRARALITAIFNNYEDVLASLESPDIPIDQWNEFGTTSYELPWRVPHERLILQGESSGRPHVRLERRDQVPAGPHNREEGSTAAFSQFSRLETTYALARLEGVRELADIDQNFALDLLGEIEFWQSVHTWRVTSPVYSYRAETGAFPEFVEDLTQAPETARSLQTTVRNFQPRIHVPSEAFSRLMRAPQGTPGIEPFPVDLTARIHATNWPEPEYQITPESNNEHPLTAPRPEDTPQ